MLMIQHKYCNSILVSSISKKKPFTHKLVQTQLYFERLNSDKHLCIPGLTSVKHSVKPHPHKLSTHSVRRAPDVKVSPIDSFMLDDREMSP